jgi:hypothetical protein
MSLRKVSEEGHYTDQTGSITHLDNSTPVLGSQR